MRKSKKSDSPIVAMKSVNKVDGTTAESMEPRGGAKRNADQHDVRRTPSRGSTTSGLDRVRQAAQADRKCRFTALLHHVTIDLLRDAYHVLKRDAAPGVDGIHA